MSLNAKSKILYENIFIASAAPTATDTDADTQYDVLNIIDYRPYTLWKAASTGTKYITIDAGSSVSADALGIMTHNFFTATCTISLEYSSDNFSGDINEALAGFIPTDDFRFMKTFTTQSARYWRLKIVTGGAVVPYLGVMLVGDIFTFEKYLLGPFDPDSEKLIAEQNVSIGGNLLGTVVNYYELPVNLRFRLLSDSWIENTFMPLWTDHLRLLKPFFFAWDITNHPTEVHYLALRPTQTLNIPFNPVTRTLSLQCHGTGEL